MMMTLCHELIPSVGKAFQKKIITIIDMYTVCVRHYLQIFSYVSNPIKRRGYGEDKWEQRGETK